MILTHIPDAYSFKLGLSAPINSSSICDSANHLADYAYFLSTNRKKYGSKKV